MEVPTTARKVDRTMRIRIDQTARIRRLPERGFGLVSVEIAFEPIEFCGLARLLGIGVALTTEYMDVPCEWSGFTPRNRSKRVISDKC
jgi:hypothetical protein